MYHEISSNETNNYSSNKLSPAYDLPVSLFEQHLREMHENGYQSLDFNEARNLSNNGKYLIITFDDGLKGNYTYALPLLKKYGFTAIFFIAVERVGSENYMNWEELSSLLEHGMSVQSHTLTHRPLQTLEKEEIFHELFTSKYILEEKLKTNVSAISFPHGSYNKLVVEIAKKIGYRWMCTSEIQKLYNNSFSDCNIFGRFAMTTKLSSKHLLDILEYKTFYIFKLQLYKSSKNLFKRIIGIDNYRRIYRKFYKIKIS